MKRNYKDITRKETILLTLPKSQTSKGCTSTTTCMAIKKEESNKDRRDQQVESKSMHRWKQAEAGNPL